MNDMSPKRAARERRKTIEDAPLPVTPGEVAKPVVPTTVLHVAYWYETKLDFGMDRIVISGTHAVRTHEQVDAIAGAIMAQTPGKYTKVVPISWTLLEG